MQTFLQTAVAGLAQGGIYGSLALALVLIYKATEVINFAQGEMAMFTTYICWALITHHGIQYRYAFFLTLVIERLPPTRYLRPFFAVGFLGSYTTFSTLAVETVLLLKDGHVALGVGYTLASVVAGLALAYVGIVLARLLPGGEYR